MPCRDFLVRRTILHATLSVCVNRMYTSFQNLVRAIRSLLYSAFWIASFLFFPATVRGSRPQVTFACVRRASLGLRAPKGPFSSEGRSPFRGCSPLKGCSPLRGCFSLRGRSPLRGCCFSWASSFSGASSLSGATLSQGCFRGLRLRPLMGRGLSGTLRGCALSGAAAFQRLRPLKGHAL